MSDETGLNLSALEKLRKLGGEKLACDMITLFLDYAPQRLSAARAGQLAGNLEAIGNAVHPLKSSAGHVGARRVQELATTIEKLSMDKAAETIPPLLQELEDAFTQIKPLLEQQRAQSSP